MGLKRIAVRLWMTRRKHVLLAVGAVIVGLSMMSVFWQLMYPPDRALPSYSIGGLGVGHKDREAIISLLGDYAQKGEVTIETPSKQLTTKWQSVGITIDPEASAEAALGYGMWERMIPFSSLIRQARSGQLPLVAIADEERLTAFAEQVVAEDKVAAKDATILVRDGVVQVDEAKNGYKFTVDSVKQQLQAAKIGTDTRVRLVPEQLPARPVAELEETAKQAEAIVTQGVTLNANGKTITPDRAMIGGWLSFPQDEQTKKFSVVINNEAIKAYLASLDKEVGQEPGMSTVTTIDGVEVSRTPAAEGLSVSTDANAATIADALRGATRNPTLTLAVAKAPPRVTYVRSYSNGDAGLLATIKDWDATHSGDFAVIIRELGGASRYAEFNPDKRYVTASTFKLFVYYGVQIKIKMGEINYGTVTDMGWTVEACLTEMIVRSTNPCAISLMNLIGWQWNEDVVRAAGFVSTYINNQGGGDKFSTVRDETNYIMRLYYGTLMDQEPTERLLGYLKRQIWRAGIPSGVPSGTVVADKVGFYNGWVHDIAIVYGPKSTYILGIMSKGGHDADFANLSKRIYSFFLN